MGNAACHSCIRRESSQLSKFKVQSSAFFAKEKPMPWCHTLAALLLSLSTAAAADWPQWLGPNRNASSTEKIAPWKEAPRVLWHQAVGEGHSSPVVAGGRVFLHTKVKGKDAEQLTAYDSRTGEPVWNQPYARDPFTSIFGNGPRATPAVVGDHVYTYGVTGIVGCFHTKDGAEAWKVDALKKFGAANLTFGASSSPLVDDNKVLVNVGGKGASVVAFSSDNGAVVWKSLDDPASYSSPILLGRGKEKQVIFVTQQGVVSLNPADGASTWKFPMVDLLNESSTTPVHAGDLLLASSVTYGTVGLQLETTEGKPNATQAWKNTALTCYFSTPVVVGKDHVYMVTGTILPPAQATLRCVEVKTGKEIWQRPKVGKYHAALLRTGDNKLLMLEDTGSLVLFDPEPKEYRELARAKVCGEVWAHPALSDGRLYLRDDKELICLQLGN
jgi:outer membrane protein assembly factor BamB